MVATKMFILIFVHVVYGSISLHHSQRHFVVLREPRPALPICGNIHALVHLILIRLHQVLQ